MGVFLRLLVGFLLFAKKRIETFIGLFYFLRPHKNEVMS